MTKPLCLFSKFYQTFSGNLSIHHCESNAHNLHFVNNSIILFINSTMKSAIVSFLALAAAGSAAAFTPETLPGALAPMGFFDPLGFAAKASPDTLKRYREAELVSLLIPCFLIHMIRAAVIDIETNRISFVRPYTIK